MGVGRRSLYDTFGDKHALFMRSLDRYASFQEDGARDIAANAPNGRDAVRGLLSVILSPDGSTWGCFVVNTATEVAARDSEVAKRVDEHQTITRKVLLDAVRTGQQDGSIANQSDPEVLTSVLYNAWLGLRVGVRAGISHRRLRKDINDMMRLLDGS